MTEKEFKEKGSIRIEELGLRTRAYYALRRLNCATVAEVIQAGPGAVWGCRNCGITTLREINAKGGSIPMSIGFCRKACTRV